MTQNVSSQIDGDLMATFSSRQQIREQIFSLYILSPVPCWPNLFTHITRVSKYVIHVGTGRAWSLVNGWVVKEKANAIRNLRKPTTNGIYYRLSGTDKINGSDNYEFLFHFPDAALTQFVIDEIEKRCATNWV